MFEIKINGENLGTNSTIPLFKYFLEHGTEFDSRLGPTFELLGATMRFPASMVPYRPGMVRRLGYVELLQVLSGYFDERHLKKAAPGLRYPYGHVHAYGTKIYQQLPNVIKQLKENPESRRAMIHIGKPEDGYETDKPCMQSYQFMVRSGRLYSFLYARSWDIVSGLPYDVMTVNGVAQAIAKLLDVSFSTTTVFAASAHLYVGSFNDMLARHADKLGGEPPFKWSYIRQGFSSLDDVRMWAMDQLNDMDNWKHGTPKGIRNG